MIVDAFIDQERDVWDKKKLCFFFLKKIQIWRFSILKEDVEEFPSFLFIIPTFAFLYEIGKKKVFKKKNSKMIDLKLDPKLPMVWRPTDGSQFFFLCVAQARPLCQPSSSVRFLSYDFFFQSFFFLRFISAFPSKRVFFFSMCCFHWIYSEYRSKWWVKRTGNWFFCFF